jgi:Xaa-Pro aminopeptidase
MDASGVSIDFQRRRKRVIEAMGDGVLVVFAAPYLIRNNDVEHEWRQESDFHYLSGFDEPDSVLVLRGGAEPRFVLFVRPRDPEREAWDGPRAGVEGALTEYGADAAFPLEELSKELPPLLGNVGSVHYALGRARANDDVVLGAIDAVRRLARRGSASLPRAIVDPASVLHEERLIKAPDEIARMERALAITAEGHRAVMAESKPGMYEYEAEALLRGAFRRRGSERQAYPPIVGSGPNSTILHYRKNDRRMLDGDLLLVDAGSEYEYYASDVTRTFPINGTFAPAQRLVYELVLKAELEAIAAVRPGTTLEAVHLVAARVLTEGLIDLGLVEGPLEEAVDGKRYKPWFMHGTSHWLGMDVHDVGAYYVERKARPLAPGMVLTVEPGLYFTASDERVRPEFRGIGIRIEDDVLVTADGARVLSEAIPKHVDAVENACKG